MTTRGMESATESSDAFRRVILIGRTGLDAKLRLDPNVELIRVPSSLDALGELAACSSCAGQNGAGTVIVIAPDADAQFMSPQGENELREFTRAVRRLDPAARSLWVGTKDSNRWPDLVDGTIEPDASADQLRKALRPAPSFTPPPAPAPMPTVPVVKTPAFSPVSPAPLASPTPTVFVRTNAPPQASPPSAATMATRPPTASAPTPAATPATPSIPMFEASTSTSVQTNPASAPSAAHDAGKSGTMQATPSMAGSFEPSLLPVPSLADAETTSRRELWSDTGDEALVRLLLQGRDPVPAALDLITSRVGSPVTFSPQPDGPGIAVAWRGRSMGRLHSAALDDDALASHAAWLGSWLALRDQHQHLRQAAFTDSLTGAYNRRFFDLFLRSVMDEAKMQRRGVTLLVFDIDNFKQFNDRHGHPAGDQILIQTVRLIKSVIRPSDKVCRIGGDEFAVIFYDPAGPRQVNSRHPTDVSQIAERFQREVRLQKFPKLGAEAPGSLTISGGIATYPWDGRTAEELLRGADEYALASKRQGKNVITFGPDSPPDELS